MKIIGLFDTNLLATPLDCLDEQLVLGEQSQVALSPCQQILSPTLLLYLDGRTATVNQVHLQSLNRAIIVQPH